MAKQLSVSNVAALAIMNALVDLLDGGTTNPSGQINVYSGTVPTNVDTALSGNTLLAELVLTNPAFGAAADTSPGARATAATITADSAANATGTATFFRAVNRDGTAVLQGTVGTSDADLILDDVSIVTGQQVSISSWTIDLAEVAP